MTIDAAARVFASNYQLVICDDPMAFTEESNWGEGDLERGFAGNEHFRMVGTEADLNDHWVEVQLSEDAPELTTWDRVTCVGLQCATGRINVMSVVDEDPTISIEVPVGAYSIFVAACNLGIDQSSLGEEGGLTDEQLAGRKDLEWYRIFVVPGSPRKVGRLNDEPTETAG